VELGEIASIALATDSAGQAIFGAIGYWGCNAVHIMSIPELEIADTFVEASLPRSIVIKPDTTSPVEESESNHLMLIGQGDGTVTTRRLSWRATQPGLGIYIGDRNVMTLGRTPVQLASVPESDGSSNILSISDRVSIIYEEQDRLSRSPLNLNVSDLMAWLMTAR
jgi:hypothetical protein